MSGAAELLDELYLTPDARPVDATNSSHREWGFTIYRTAYGPTSNQRWQNLLEVMQTKTKEHIIEQSEADHDLARLWSLFRIDAISDEKSLSGLNIDQVRDLYNSTNATQPMNKTDSLRRAFLVADDEVLSDAGATTVKAVSADYTPVPYDPRPNSRGLRQRYFGWMNMTTGSVMDLWKDLGNREFESIAPPTIGGSHLVVWEGVDY